MAHQERKTESSRHGGALPLAVTAALFVVLRLFAVSGYDWHTAFAVLHTMDVDDSVSIVVGTLMADSFAAAAYLTLLTPIALLWMRMGLQTARRLRTQATAERLSARSGLRSGALLLFSLVATLGAYVWTFHAWWLPLIALAATVLLFALAYGTKAGGRLQRVALWTGRRLGMLITVGWLIAAATVKTPWVPLEHVELRGGVQLRGYVLRAEPGFLKLLTEREREFRILSDNDVTSRREISGH